jgi:succinoglycan biosynthesis transport protein ExoP
LPEPEEESDLIESLSRLAGIITRRRWWILAPACCVTLAAIAVLLFLPNRYTSEATLVVVEQQIPQRYVVPNSTTDLTSALDAIKQEVMSRNRLLKMIDDFGLYPKQRKRLAPEELVLLMLKNIDIAPIGGRTPQRDFDAFKISFTTESALLAQQVTSTLTSLFINENLRTREQQASNTTKFLHEQLETKKKQLDEQEQRLRDFKMQHIGELPEQQQGNLGILTGLQTQLQNTMSALNRAEQQRVYLQSLIDAYKRQAPLPGIVGAVSASPAANPILTPVEMAQNDLARLESTRTALLSKYTPEHPDVLKIQREIAKVQDVLKHLRAATPPAQKDAGSPASARTVPNPASPTEAPDEPALAQIRSQLEANRSEIQNLSKDETRLKATMGQYENRLNQTPVREQQQAGIIRDTEALRQEYAELQKKEQESQLATNLEKQQGGQQFRLIDPASMPTVPSSPKRLKLSMTGAIGGLVLGLALAFFMEMRDTSFRSEKDLVLHSAPPFVLGIPLLTTKIEKRWLRQRSILEWLAGSALVFMVLIAELYVYKHG